MPDTPKHWNPPPMFGLRLAPVVIDDDGFVWTHEGGGKYCRRNAEGHVILTVYSQPVPADV